MDEVSGSEVNFRYKKRVLFFGVEMVSETPGIRSELREVHQYFSVPAQIKREIHHILKYFLEYIQTLQLLVLCLSTVIPFFEFHHVSVEYNPYQQFHCIHTVNTASEKILTILQLPSCDLSSLSSMLHIHSLNRAY